MFFFVSLQGCGYVHTLYTIKVTQESEKYFSIMCACQENVLHIVLFLIILKRGCSLQNFHPDQFIIHGIKLDNSTYNEVQHDNKVTSVAVK